MFILLNISVVWIRLNKHIGIQRLDIYSITYLFAIAQNSSLFNSICWCKPRPLIPGTSDMELATKKSVIYPKKILQISWDFICTLILSARPHIENISRKRKVCFDGSHDMYILDLFDMPAPANGRFVIWTLCLAESVRSEKCK